MNRAMAMACLMLATCCTNILHGQAPVSAAPPMGWNSWNHFADKVTDADVRAAADQMVKNGMRDAGYVYVNLDDTWQGTRDANGVLHTNSRFPDMKGLADYVHSKGLKFGIYSSPGAKTCGGYAGSLDHEVQDATMYAAWGVDFLKYDLCSFMNNVHAEENAHPNDPLAGYKLMIAAYKKMGDALKQTGRPILYSLCQYGLDEPWKFGTSVGAQMWRTTDDIKDDYGRMMTIAFSQVGLEQYAGPDRWNDPDMLEIGNGGMTFAEYQTHMTLWCLLAAPLLAGNDLGKMSEAEHKLLTNRTAIAIDQDPLGKQAKRVWQRGDFSLWAKPLSGGRIALGVVNTSWQNRDIPVDLREIGLSNGADALNVWEGTPKDHWSGLRFVKVAKHGAALFLLTPGGAGKK